MTVTEEFLDKVHEIVSLFPDTILKKWIGNPKALKKALENPPGTATAPKQEPIPLPLSITIDTDRDPKIPSGLYLAGEGTEHRKMGKMKLEKRMDGKLYANDKEVIRHLSPNQQNGKNMKGHALRNELKDKQVLNACILDALLANPQLIPDEWKNGRTYFWGTIFRDADGSLCVEYLFWDDDRWNWYCHWLDNDWNDGEPAASLD